MGVPLLSVTTPETFFTLGVFVTLVVTMILLFSKE